jgi:hypothetical protein
MVKRNSKCQQQQQFKIRGSTKLIS